MRSAIHVKRKKRTWFGQLWCVGQEGRGEAGEGVEVDFLAFPLASRGHSRRNRPVYVCVHILRRDFSALRSNPNPSPDAPQQLPVMAVWKLWAEVRLLPGEKLLMLRRPSSSEGENGNQFVGHVTRVRWDWVAALTIKGDLPSLASPLVRAQAALINLKRVCKDSHRLLWTLLWWTIYFLSFFCWCCHEYLRTWILEHLPKASSDQAVQNGHIFKMYTLVHNNMEAQTLYWLSTFDKGSAQVVAGKLHLQFWVACLPAD